jgi:hypothetical protein
MSSNVSAALAALTELYDAPLAPSRARRRRTEMADVLKLGDQLSERERRAVQTIADLRLATHAQLAALTAPRDAELTEDSAARAARRLLAGLTDAGLLARLERRIGGVRAGSAGYVYYLGPVGQRLVAYWEGRGVTRGRVRPEPGPRFVRHRLMVSQMYVDAHLANEAGLLDLLAFTVEPDCWRSYVDGRGQKVILKPDASARIRTDRGDRRVFIEVDLATESRPVVERKLRTYIDYFNADDRECSVLLVTPTTAREVVLEEVRQTLTPEARDRFRVATLDGGVERLGSIDRQAA